MHRYTRVNIYNTVELDGWRWYQVGPTAWVHQTQVAKSMPVARPTDVTTEQWISIDLYEQTLVAYEGDKPIFTTLIASGLPRWPTNEGTFHIYWRRMREDMSWGKPGDDFYYLEEVPWTMFFDEGRALHGAYWHDGFGYRRSHGCVNMSITDAHWLYHWVAEIMGSRASADLEEGPQVYIHSSGTYNTG
jgi:lipoprotein-anchoring transpeptidase ErfK/SrfK